MPRRPMSCASVGTSPGRESAMVDTHPETGRHHQIRAHLRSIGTPILFDRVYGLAAGAAIFADAPSQRLALHASKLVVLDAGEAGLARTFEAPLPDDLDGPAALAGRYFFAWLTSAWSSRE